MPEPAHGLSLGAAAVRWGGDLLRLGRLREAESVLHRALMTRDSRDRSTLLRATFYLAGSARTAGKSASAMEQYRQLLRHAEHLGRWDYEALAHAGIGLCLLDLHRLDEAEDEWAFARAALGNRQEWFEDRELLEIFIARVQVLNRSVDLAQERLARAAAALQGRDPHRWAQVELERVLVLSEVNPPAADALLERIARETAELDAPPLHDRITAVRRIVAETSSARAS